MYIDLLTRIKNAQLVKKESVKAPYSKIDEEIVEILAKNNYLKGYEKKGRKIKRILHIELRYEKGKGAINGIKFISKPSRRIYVSYREIKPVKHGYGLSILSTSKGIMAGPKAKKMKIGGEILFEIW
jgi:small subunit ribosomal protein S8